MRLFLQLVTVAAVAMAGSLAVSAVQWNTPLTLVLGFGSAALVVLAYRWIVRKTEHRVPGEITKNNAALGRGLVIGLGLFACVIGNIALVGGYDVLGWGSLGGALALFGFSAAAAVTEEVLFRGILFRFVERWIGTWLALTLTGLLFGLSHLFNTHATLWGAIAIAVEAGGMLAAAYAATRTLWLPIGLHFAWNFAEGGIFGAGVSGTDAPEGLLHSVMSGPAALTGGEFGPEASVYSVVAGVVVTAVFMVLARRRGNIVTLRRRTADAATVVA
ncbi:CPBP family intramembrane glutamic endopeptidase [Amycolatopsis sp. NPDC051371]|uniref:CPBP family intramembrane glutamic endopeptidase n=1 Tax=Amycolatopsis sp. NPDC051371 TaxID=3155800 RepID=UPI00344000E4